MLNVDIVVKKCLCHGCGTCYAVCQKNAIDMKYNEEAGHFTPVINENCINCSLCLKVCPGYELDVERLDNVISKTQPENSNVGVFTDCYVGYSTNPDIRFDSASGGLITQILVTLLEEKMITGALVTSMNPTDPMVPMAILATSKEEIIEASKSKYCPVTLADALKLVMKTDGRYAVVGLPCHIHGLRKAEQQFPQLRKKVVIRLGLLCSHMVGFPGIEFLLSKIGTSHSSLAKMQYRGRGWPGSMLIKNKNREVKIIPLVTGWNSYWPIFSSYFFTPIRCMMCPDQMAELADMSFGDAWLPAYFSDKIGQSIVISKNYFSDNILREMTRKGQINLRQLPVHEIEKSQQPNLVFKKIDIGARIALLSKYNQNVPILNPQPKVNLSFISVLRTLLVLNSYWLSNKTIFRRIGVYIPFPLFRLYSGCFKYLYKI